MTELVRCPWSTATEEYRRYHDEEWGVELHGDRQLYERVSLEGFQSGLSWLTILRKREAFRDAFAGFDPAVVAEFDESDVERLMANTAIIRNRAKILATIRNARATAELGRPLDELLWSFAPAKARRRPRTMREVPSVTEESTAMAKSLRKHGFAFVGPTTCYALMQATGMVDDHLADCWRAGPSIAGRDNS
ncbi:MAG: DNA-3-methyladenine glycosylase I [Kutzneria sp.]|nr:DNA-3-methyladenine glycosylase I [Kutzneria sp.]MBV9847995.1 DNA-3-methyladenine glycosylase I [Kutzneria sp.]